MEAQASGSYHDYLIKSLQDPEEAAAYLEAILEEEDPEPELLKVALLDVAEALGKADDASEKRKFYSKELDEILSQSGSQEVYGLTNWLNSLGLKLTVAIAEDDHEQIVKNVKAPTSDSYHDYLVSYLTDPSYAALYLETHFEEEEDQDPDLLKLALSDVLEALSRSNRSPEQTKLHTQKLDKLLFQQGSDVIYGLSQQLNELGLKLTVAVADQEHEQMKLRYSIFIQWSDEDQKYIVNLPEFGPYAHTHGDTYEEADI